MITFDAVSKYYGQGLARSSALDHVSLEVPKGSIFGIIGHSGAGKSTLLRCANLLERPDQGRVLFEGQDILHASASTLRNYRQKMGMVFQGCNLVSVKTAAENINIPFALQGISNTQPKIEALLARVGLSGYGNRYPAELSGGQRQRISIARALALNPSVLLCDEATSALDPAATQSILSLVKQLNRDLGLTILLITHEMEVVKTICDQVAVMDKGQVVEAGKVFDVFSAPQHPTTRRFIEQVTHMSIPDAIQSLLLPEATSDTDTLYRITYVGEVTSRPLLSILTERFGVSANIIQANIETLQDKTLGQIMVTLSGDACAMQQGLAFLRENHLNIEVLGHVKRNT